MGADLGIVVVWWMTLMIIGVAAFPFTRKFFGKWHDGGYFLTKSVGLMVVTFGSWWLAWVHALAFSWISVALVTAGLFLIGLYKSNFDLGNIDYKRVFAYEVFFLAMLVMWVWVKGHEPSIRGLEKFMDFGFAKSITESKWLPAEDMWYEGKPINYYYFGHTMMAVVAKLSGVDLGYGFNLMLCTLFALTATMSFGISFELLRGVGGKQRFLGSILTAFLVTLGGNLHTIYAFTIGYDGEKPVPFWEIMTDKSIQSQPTIAERFSKYWYPNATRFIPFTIHEFPGYSFVVSDVHGHVLSLGLVLLCFAILVELFAFKRETNYLYGLYGLTVAAAFTTNASDGPIYLGVFGVLLLFVNKSPILNKIAKGFVVLLVFMASVFPFMFNFNSFVSGLGVNCPPASMQNQKVGPLIFETVDKCQKSPLWMMALLWGLGWYSGAWLLAKSNMFSKDSVDININKFLVWIWVVAIGLVVFAEFFYFKDIYPAHFRSNTMFKLGYQAFIWWGLITGYVFAWAWQKGQKLIMVTTIPLLLLVGIYPRFAVRSYFGELSQENYKSIYGMDWMKQQYPGDYAAISWLENETYGLEDRPTVIEAVGDSYTDYARISAFTGLPTIVGWPVHEWLWRGSYDVAAPRIEEVRRFYEEGVSTESEQLIKKYNVGYVVVGQLERQKYLKLDEKKISSLGRKVFEESGTVIYKVGNE